MIQVRLLPTGVRSEADRRPYRSAQHRAVAGVPRAVVVAVFMLSAVSLWAATATVEASNEERSVGSCTQLACIRCLISNGDFEEAERRARTLLRVAEKQCGQVSTCVSEVLHALVDALRMGGSVGDPETLKLARRMVSIDREIYGANHEQAADSLVQLAMVLDARGETQKARKYLDRALKLHQRSPDPNAASLSVIHNNLGAVLRRHGRFAEAEDHFETALALGEQAFAPDDPRLITTLVNLANLYSERGEIEESREVFDTAVAATESRLGAGHLGLAMQLNGLGHILMDQGNLHRATEYFEQSLSIAEQLYGPDSPDLSCILGNLGIAYLQMGDPRADGHINRAVEIAEEKDFYQAAIWLENLALVEGAWDHGGARRKYERALELFEQTVGPDSFRVASVHNGLAVLLASIGEYREAVAHLEEAKRVFDASMGSKSKFTMFAHFDLADTYASLGMYDHSRSILEDLLVTIQEVYGAHHPEVAATFEELALLEKRAGNHPKASDYCDQARTIRDGLARGGDDVPADSLALYASFEADSGNWQDARQLLTRAAEINEATFGSINPNLGAILAQLAAAELALGDLEGAHNAAIRAEHIARHHFTQTIPSLSEREALRYSDVRVSGLDIALTVAAGGDVGDPESSWDALIRSRALVLDEMSLRNRTVIESDDLELRDTYARLQGKSTQIANLTVRGLHSPELRDLYESAQQEKERLERRLSERSRSFRIVHSGHDAGFEEVADALPSDAALVAYARYRAETVADEGFDATGDTQDRSAYLAFVMNGSSRNPIVVPLGGARDIDDTVNEMRLALAEVSLAPGRSPTLSEAAYRRIGADLRTAVWDPIAPHLGRVQRIFVVPDGALNLVNLAALPSGATGYLIEAVPPIHYLSSERDLITEIDQPGGRGLLAIGAPAFDDRGVFAAYRGEEESFSIDDGAILASKNVFRGARATCGDFKSMLFEDLPASDEELDQIVEVWQSTARSRPTLRGPQSGGSEVAVLRGSNATEARFKELASGRRVLHIATHGFFLGEGCASMLKAAYQRSAQKRGAYVVDGENPLLMSGFALAGANHRGLAGPQEEDGILTAEEIAALDLTDVEWAVLSACDTGVGVIRAGEGIFGLRRAFEIAGARTLIMSLWPVEDQASQQWMLRLYENRFTGGMTTVDAVHEASLGLLLERRENGESTHPFFWAGFIASGDWR